MVPLRILNLPSSESFVLNASDSYDQDGDDLVYYEWQAILSGELQSISNSFIHTVETINYSTIDSVLGEHQYKLIVNRSAYKTNMNEVSKIISEIGALVK